MFKIEKVQKYKEFPTPVSFWKMLGPSFLMLALGFGSGEISLWPYLVSNFGLGLAWGALLGITCQYFINMEIERYALVKGESVFVGLYRQLPILAHWFSLTTFLGFALPGIISASAKIFGVVFGVGEYRFIAIFLLIFIGLLLSASVTVYARMEKITRILIFGGLTLIFALTFQLAKVFDWQTLFAGLVGKGDGFWLLPSGISLSTFLGAFVYSGAGGNLNLAQSIYIREKGYGMGFYSQKLSGFFRHIRGHQSLVMTGYEFEKNDQNLATFRKWWKKISLEHLLIFWGGGLLGMLLLMLLSYISAYGSIGNQSGIDFVINQASHLASTVGPNLSVVFLIAIGVLLFQTQLGVLDASSRIICENIALLRGGLESENKINLSKIYFFILWSQIFFGIVLLAMNFHEPKTLIVTGAVINAIAMTVHIGLVTFLNLKSLPQNMQAPPWRYGVILAIFFIFVGFCFITFTSFI